MKSGKSGTITLPFNGQSMIRLRFIDKGRPGDDLLLNGKESRVSIPAGRYKLESFYCMVSGKDDAKWIITSSAASEQSAKTIRVRPGANIRLRLGRRSRHQSIPTSMARRSF